MKTYPISLFGVKETTQVIANHLYNNGIKVDLIISIDPSVAKKNDIANYVSLELTAKLIGADYYCVKDYTLNNISDRFFQDNQFELGIVYGWQRLIPEHIMSQFHQGIFGFHASPDILPKGRGRSPINWSIILGKTTLYNHCFRYAVNADSGDIFSITPFEIMPHDTILTLLYKSLITAKREIIRLIHDIKHHKLQLMPQEGDGYFFPKRNPQDGLIQFEHHSTKEIVNLIRGVTKPFSGAFCFTESGKKITIWEAWEFDYTIDFSMYSPGAVIDNLYGFPIIKTKDGSLIIKDYDGYVLMSDNRLYSSL